MLIGFGMYNIPTKVSSVKYTLSVCRKMYLTFSQTYSIMESINTKYQIEFVASFVSTKIYTYQAVCKDV